MDDSILTPVLTPEQQAKIEKIKKRRKERVAEVIEEYKDMPLFAGYFVNIPSQTLEMFANRLFIEGYAAGVDHNRKENETNPKAD